MIAYHRSTQSHFIRNFKCKGTTINDLGRGPEEIERKKISEVLLQGKKLYGRGSREKINSFRKFPPPPLQIINGRPLILYEMISEVSLSSFRSFILGSSHYLQQGFSPGIMWMDLNKIATKGLSTELSSTRSQNPRKKCEKNSPKLTFRNDQPSGFLVCCSGHLKEMHCLKKPFVAFLSHSGSVLGYNDWTKNVLQFLLISAYDKNLSNCVTR